MIVSENAEVLVIEGGEKAEAREDLRTRELGEGILINKCSPFTDNICIPYLLEIVF